MKNLFAVLLAGLALTGCVAYPVATVYTPAVEVYESDVLVGPYYVGYYNPAFGYWTGTGWDVNFYLVGHGGYGHYYRGAPAYARGHYRARFVHPMVRHH